MRHKLSKDGLIGNVDKMLKCLTLQNSVDLWQFTETISCSWQIHSKWWGMAGFARWWVVFCCCYCCSFFFSFPSSRKTLKCTQGHANMTACCWGRMLREGKAEISAWSFGFTTPPGLTQLPLPLSPFPLQITSLCPPTAPRLLQAGFPLSSPSQSYHLLPFTPPLLLSPGCKITSFLLFLLLLNGRGLEPREKKGAA